MSVLLLLLLSLLFSSFSHVFSVNSSAKSITLSLSRPSPVVGNRLDNLKYHVAASLARAHHLKHVLPTAHIPLYPRSYGGYSVALKFGTPPQTLRFVMDTGSSLVWFPCTTHYTCTDCNISKAEPTTFIPKSSSSYKILTCNSPQCGLLFGPSDKCKNPTLPCGYIFRYGLGNTTGLLLSELLTIPGLPVVNFTAGCSFSSAYMPEGIVGFGRARESLPSQLGLKAFSYCLVSHDFDNNTKVSSDLVLTTTRGRGKRPSANIQYTPFLSNPTAYPEYYYVSLQKIIIGGVDVKVPAKYLVPDAEGDSGTIVDSGTTFTQMEKPVFDLVFKEVKKQVGKKYTRAVKIEQQKNGLKPCYNVPAVDHKNKIKLPQLTFRFEGGAEMVLPLANYFSYANDDSSVVCMTIQNYGEVGPGPAIILGNYQQQDYYMEYDLENKRLGILQRKCI